ncbi:MAG TPA: efflux RND transporter periplasmic adaptor subunit [Pseudomonadota bacterium]|nr:efflux RND transporter periplasmic adaptor subunit [Pseudomonadota bacterium]
MRATLDSAGSDRRLWHWLWLWLPVLLLALVGCRGTADSANLPVFQVKRQAFARVIPAEGQLKPVRSTAITVPPDVPYSLRITWLATDGATVKAGDPLVRFDDTELKSRLLTAQSAEATADAKRQKEQILQRLSAQDHRRSVESAERDLSLLRTFQSRDPALFARDRIIEGEIDAQQQQAKASHAQGSERVERQLSQKKIALIDVEAERAKVQIQRTEKGLRALSLAAPHDGIFTLRRPAPGEVLRVGDQVTRSMSVGEVSTIDPMEAEVFVLEAEAAGLVVGRKAEIAIEAQPDRIFAGQVKLIETVAKRISPRSPTQYFGVTLSLAQSDPTVMKPGQRVQARLFLAELQALVVPRPALQERKGSWVVFRRDARGRFVEVPVTLGPATAGLASVTAGLQEGDMVALREPGPNPSPNDEARRPRPTSR